MTTRQRTTRRWAASAVVEHFLAGESLASITAKSHSSRGEVRGTFWVTTLEGHRALMQNEDTLRRWMRRKLRPRRLGRAA